MQCVENCEPDSPGKRVEYSQPVWQTLQMFLGELCCLVPFLFRIARRRWRRYLREKAMQNAENQSLISVDESYIVPYGGVHASFLRVNVPNLFGGFMPVDTEGGGPGRMRQRGVHWTTTAVLFLFPAACDICATTLMNAALIIMPVSIYQMTRGALVLWVGLFSVLFLRHHLRLYEWLSLLMVMLGVAIVGLSSVLVHPKPTMALLAHVTNTNDASAAVNAIIGLCMVLFAQIFAAMQFVYEEKVMGDHEVEPTLAVGLEGLFGSLLVLTLMPILHFLIGSTKAGHGGFFDMVTGWHQLIDNPPVLWGSAACAASIALYNMFGLSVTRTVSATARSTIDTFRTLGICAVSLWLGWEVLQPLSGLLQGLGFASLAYGTFVFNGVVAPPSFLLTEEERAAQA